MQKEILAEIKQKLGEIDIDGILGISYISEYLRNGNLTPFPVFQYTERPDSVAASLMEGRIGIIQDGTPTAMLAPTSFLLCCNPLKIIIKAFMQQAGFV